MLSPAPARTYEKESVIKLPAIERKGEYFRRFEYLDGRMREEKLSEIHGVEIPFRHYEIYTEYAIERAGLKPGSAIVIGDKRHNPALIGSLIAGKRAGLSIESSIESLFRDRVANQDAISNPLLVCLILGKQEELPKAMNAIKMQQLAHQDGRKVVVEKILLVEEGKEITGQEKILAENIAIKDSDWKDLLEPKIDLTSYTEYQELHSLTPAALTTATLPAFAVSDLRHSIAQELTFAHYIEQSITTPVKDDISLTIETAIQNATDIPLDISLPISKSQEAIYLSQEAVSLSSIGLAESIAIENAAIELVPLDNKISVSESMAVDGTAVAQMFDDIVVSTKDSYLTDSPLDQGIPLVEDIHPTQNIALSETEAVLTASTPEMKLANELQSLLRNRFMIANSSSDAILPNSPFQEIITAAEQYLVTQPVETGISIESIASVGAEGLAIGVIEPTKSVANYSNSEAAIPTKAINNYLETEAGPEIYQISLEAFSLPSLNRRENTIALLKSDTNPRVANLPTTSRDGQHAE